jgi:hypothetical protein
MTTVPDAGHATKAKRPRPKPARSILWLTAPLTADRPSGAIRITAGKLTVDYHVRELPAVGGRGFELEKIDRDAPAESRDRYHVFLSDEGHTCTCLGYERWGHCKHTEGLAALLTQRPPDPAGPATALCPPAGTRRAA